MRLGLLLAAILALGAGGAAYGATAPAIHPVTSIRHACTLTHCNRCPRGKWMCNGHCIAKNRACRLIP